MVKLKYLGETSEWYPTCDGLTVTKGWVGEVTESIAKKLMGTKKFKIVKQPKREDNNGN